MSGNTFINLIDFLTEISKAKQFFFKILMLTLLTEDKEVEAICEKLRISFKKLEGGVRISYFDTKSFLVQD